MIISDVAHTPVQNENHQPRALTQEKQERINKIIERTKARLADPNRLPIEPKKALQRAAQVKQHLQNKYGCK